jgi:hypothetical protein
MKDFLELLLGTGLYLLEQSDRTNVRGRGACQIDDLSEVVRQKYEDAADRVAKASRAIRGDDSHVLGNALRLAAGIGIGIGVGLLLALPRDNELGVESVQEFRTKARQQVFDENARSTTATG